MFSWEVPIEQETINFCEHMAHTFRGVESANHKTGWFANNSFSEQAGCMAKAYKTVANHVREQVKLRKSITTKEST